MTKEGLRYQRSPSLFDRFDIISTGGGSTASQL